MSTFGDFVIENGILTKYQGNASHVVIPGGITEIAEDAFASNRTVVQVTVPEGVTKIGDRAFHSCFELVQITLPESLEEIGYSAFDNCGSLTSIVIPDRVKTIQKCTFQSCPSLEQVSLPSGLMEIGTNAFWFCRSLSEIRFPDSLTTIGAGAFTCCSNLKDVKLPESLVTLGDAAFNKCENFKSIVIPAGIQTIPRRIFQECTSLTKVTLPDKLTRIDAHAFFGCNSLTQIMLPDTVETVGDGAFACCANLETVTLPDGVKKIGTGIFADSPKLNCGLVLRNAQVAACYGDVKCVSVPEGITTISPGAFGGNTAVREIILPESISEIGDSAFAAMDMVEFRMPENVAKLIRMSTFFYIGFFHITTNLSNKDVRHLLHVTMKDGKEISLYIVFPEKESYNCRSSRKTYFEKGTPDLKQYDLDVANGKSFNATDKLYAALVRMANPVQMGKDAKGFYTELLKKNVKKAVAIACERDKAQWINALFAVGAIDSTNLKAMTKLINDSHADACKALLSEKAADVAPTKQIPTKKASAKQATPAKQTSPSHPIETFCKENFDAKTIHAAVKKAVTYTSMLEEVRYADRKENAPAFVVECAIGPYIAQMQTRPKQIGRYQRDYLTTWFDEKADQVAAALDRKSLLTMLRNLTEKEDCKGPQSFIPLCRFGTAADVKYTLSRINDWDDWGTYSSSGRSAIIVARGAILLNESREAMMYAEKCKILGAYATMRGMDEETVRDTKLADFGLDENGCKQFDLGSTVIEASVGQDLTVCLYDTKAQKTVKSLPKKGADEQKHAAASAELSDLKKNLKKIIKGRNEILFDRFLDGRTQKATSWIASYTKNPVLHRVAELIVWSQRQNTFILTRDGIVDCNGAEYTIDESAPVGVAHPMDMKAEEISAWQKFFTSHGLKQPFEQIWEPVVEKATVTETRYAGCMIPFYRFKGREKHGITVEDFAFHNEIHISFAGCTADVARIDWARHTIDMNHRFEVKNISFRTLTRKVNHILAYLDRCTVYDRIVNDDVSIATLLPSFTLAQITEFIKLASENSCTNVTAVLLDYQQKTFSDFDPMAEFTLD